MDDVIQSLHKGSENFDFANKGNLDKYLGVEVKELGGDTFELLQPHLLERIIEFVGLHGNDVKLRDTPVGKPLLNKDLDGVP